MTGNGTDANVSATEKEFNRRDCAALHILPRRHSDPGVSVERKSVFNESPTEINIVYQPHE